MSWVRLGVFMNLGHNIRFFILNSKYKIITKHFKNTKWCNSLKSHCHICRVTLLSCYFVILSLVFVIMEGLVPLADSHMRKVWLGPFCRFYCNNSNMTNMAVCAPLWLLSGLEFFLFVHEWKQIRNRTTFFLYFTRYNNLWILVAPELDELLRHEVHFVAVHTRSADSSAQVRLTP